MTAQSIAGRVALELGLPPDDERVVAAVDAAITLATVYVYGTEDTVNPLALDLENPSISAGLVELAVRVQLGPRSPAGALESDVYAGVNLPEDILTHLHGYFDAYRTAAAHGIA